MFGVTVSGLTLADFAAAPPAPAFANPGTDQMALQLGGQPGVHTRAQLIGLQNARWDNARPRADFILSQGNDVVNHGGAT